jgi:sulfite reductase (NADPH) flavoprotein alpha-component
MSGEWLSPGTERLLAAACVLGLYLLLCAAVWQARRRRCRQAAGAAAELATGGGMPVLVAFASQTGLAEQLATQTAQALHAAGVPVRLLPLGQLTAADMAGASRALFIASSYGEGDPPDAATPFVRRVMAARPGPALQGLRHATLALGDRSYTRFCGFGRELDAWLQQQGAQALFERIEVDRADPAALAQWEQRLAGLTGGSALPAMAAQGFEPWHIVRRQQVNSGSVGDPLFHLELEPAPGVALPAWESGDLVQVQVPVGQARPREYSVASIPADGRVHLLVRQHRKADGSLGWASGWLTTQARPEDRIPLRLRPHSGFRLGDNAAWPLILIGNGSGLAGLRGHLRARAATRAGPNWLVFGERQAAHDRPYREDIDGWLASGLLTQADLVFSRDQPERRHVQHRLRERAADLRQWVAEGAAVYVCGSLQGMAAGVHQALAEILGTDTLEQLSHAGRYRRDVY